MRNLAIGLKDEKTQRGGIVGSTPDPPFTVAGVAIRSLML
jgi:hypothetical protein